VTATVDGDLVRLKLSGLLGAGQEATRDVLFEELYSQLPRDPEARVCIYAWEIAPLGHTAWHLHNGPAFMIPTEGRIVIQFKDEERPFEAGDVYYEPVGVVHRAFNPDPERSVCGIAWIATSPDREHVVNVKEPW
jgi:quercetin dioxygenase-like cupin family protein